MNTIKTNFETPSSTARLRGLAIVFTLLAGLFILTACGNLDNLATLLKGGFDPNDCNLNPFGAHCEETEEQKKALAPRRQALIEPVVAECTINPLAERCRDAFVFCGDFENTNEPECEKAVRTETGVFSCLKDPYQPLCAEAAALQETISGEVPVIDEATGDVVIDEKTGEVKTETKTVTLVENTIQARINYCREGDNAQNPDNAVLCESTIVNVCENSENPAGVFDVFCRSEAHATARLNIAEGCRDGEITTVEQGCTSVVDFCNTSPFGNPNCNIPAFATARVARVDMCIVANDLSELNGCGIALANNDCFEDPFNDGVAGLDCADANNFGNAENVEIAKQNRAVVCVNVFNAGSIASSTEEGSADLCGGAKKEVCVTNPFGVCADFFGGQEQQTTAQEERAQYCVIGDKTNDPLCVGVKGNACITDPTGTSCVAFFGTAQAQTNAQTQRTNYCNGLLIAGGATAIEGDTLCDKIVENACALNPFAKSALSANCLDNGDFAVARRNLVDACRNGREKQEGEDTDPCTTSNIDTCNDNPYGPYADNRCDKSHFDGARSDYPARVARCLVNPKLTECGEDDSRINSCNSEPFAIYTIGGVRTDICGFDHYDDARNAYCQENPFASFSQCQNGYATERLQLVNDCRNGVKTEVEDCGTSGGQIALCNNNPYGTYSSGETALPNFCTAAHFDGARVAYCQANPFAGATQCQGPEFAPNRLELVNDCRNEDRTAGCGGLVGLCNGNPFVNYTAGTPSRTFTCNDPAYDDTKKLRVVFCNANTGDAKCMGNLTVAGICAYDPFAAVCFSDGTYDSNRVTTITKCSVRADSDTGACATVLKRPTAASWLKSFATPLRTTATTANQFLTGTIDGISTTGTSATATTLMIEGEDKNGVGFFTAGNHFYAGLFSGANLGAPLDDAGQGGAWMGKLRAVVGSTIGEELEMTLDVVYTGSANTIKAFVATGDALTDERFLLDGTFTANGVISGTVNYGVFTNGVEGTPAGGRGTNGTLTGLIGQDGALGAFHSTATGNTGYAGGFVATKPE